MLKRYPEADCWRIDLVIGEKAYWGQGLGTEVIQLLTAFAFDEQGADLVFGCDVADDDVASRKAFQKAGYTVDARIVQPVGRKARCCYDLVVTREPYITGEPEGRDALTR